MQSFSGTTPAAPRVLNMVCKASARGVILLREMAEGKLLASLLDQLQQFYRALIVGKVTPVGLDAGAQVVGIPPAAEHVEVVVAFQLPTRSQPLRA